MSTARPEPEIKRLPVVAAEEEAECLAAELELPVLGGPPRMRADAVRNHRKVLAAARRLFERDGVHCVSMDAIAAEAGVGKGTLFRRFGDRATLARAVLDEREREFQERLIRGPAPLGPGAPPAERLMAFGAGFVSLLEHHGDLLLASQVGRSPLARFRSAPYDLYRTHIGLLVREAAPELDAVYVAEVLMEALGPALYHHQRETRGARPDEIADNFATLVRRLVAPR